MERSEIELGKWYSYTHAGDDEQPVTDKVKVLRFVGATAFKRDSWEGAKKSSFPNPTPKDEQVEVETERGEIRLVRI